MNTLYEILRTLGRIEGELKVQAAEMRNALAEIRRLSERVRTIELCHAWLRGAWAMLVAAYAYLCRQALRLANVL